MGWPQKYKNKINHEKTEPVANEGKAKKIKRKPVANENKNEFQALLAVIKFLFLQLFGSHK